MVGKILYHYLPLRGIGKYEVIGEDGEFVIAKCLACNNQKHPCIVKLNREDGYKEGRWKYVSMLQYCGDDTYIDSNGCEVHDEYIWHNDSPYFESKSACKRFIGEKIISDYEIELFKLEHEVKRKKEKIKELKVWMEEL